MTNHTKANKIKPNAVEAIPVAQATPLYHALVTLLVFFKKDEAVNQRHFNATLATAGTTIRRVDIDALIQNIIKRAADTMKIQADDVVDVIILNISPIGHMTQNEFTGEVAAS